MTFPLLFLKGVKRTRRDKDRRFGSQQRGHPQLAPAKFCGLLIISCRFLRGSDKFRVNCPSPERDSWDCTQLPELGMGGRNCCEMVQRCRLVPSPSWNVNLVVVYAAYFIGQELLPCLDLMSRYCSELKEKWSDHLALGTFNPIFVREDNWKDK